MGLQSITVRRSARIAGCAGFALVEVFILAATLTLFSIRCCGSGPSPGPQSAGDWMGLMLFALIALAIGAAVGCGLALASEGALRLADKVRQKP